MTSPDQHPLSEQKPAMKADPRPLWARLLRISPEAFEPYDPQKDRDLALPAGDLAVKAGIGNSERTLSPSEWLRDVQATQKDYMRQLQEAGIPPDDWSASLANAMNQNVIPRIASILVAKDGTASFHRLHGEVPSDALKGSSYPHDIYYIGFRPGYMPPDRPESHNTTDFYATAEQLNLFKPSELTRITLDGLGLR